jgi:membrane protein
MGDRRSSNRGGGTPPSGAEPTRSSLVGNARNRYEDSVVQELFRRLRALDFLNTVVLFGAAVLLSALPFVIILGTFANERIDDDIARHLGLSNSSARIVSSLFRSSASSFNTAALVSLLLGVCGTLAVAGSVQLIYERVFDHDHARERNVLRWLAWIVGLAALVLLEAVIHRPVRRSAGRVPLELVHLGAVMLFFWWTMHFLLGGREPGQRLVRPAVTTAVFWMGLGVFTTVYFSSAIASDSKLYGTIGVVFSLMTWFIAMGAVIVLGGVVGAMWNERRS